jgi:hypothetical protein
MNPRDKPRDETSVFATALGETGQLRLTADPQFHPARWDESLFAGDETARRDDKPWT